VRVRGERREGLWWGGGGGRVQLRVAAHFTVTTGRVRKNNSRDARRFITALGG
jgi:hypothetical protein